MKDLPEGCCENNNWTKIFIPTYIWFVGQQDDPWNVDDMTAKSAMQKIWKSVYGKNLAYKITTDTPVFSIVSFCFLPQDFGSVTSPGPTTRLGYLAIRDWIRWSGYRQ